MSHSTLALRQISGANLSAQQTQEIINAAADADKRIAAAKAAATATAVKVAVAAAAATAAANVLAKQQPVITVKDLQDTIQRKEQRIKDLESSNSGLKRKNAELQTTLNDTLEGICSSDAKHVRKIEELEKAHTTAIGQLKGKHALEKRYIGIRLQAEQDRSRSALHLAHVLNARIPVPADAAFSQLVHNYTVPFVASLSRDLHHLERVVEQERQLREAAEAKVESLESAAKRQRT